MRLRAGTSCAPCGMAPGRYAPHLEPVQVVTQRGGTHRVRSGVVACGAALRCSYTIAATLASVQCQSIISINLIKPLFKKPQKVLKTVIRKWRLDVLLFSAPVSPSWALTRAFIARGTTAVFMRRHGTQNLRAWRPNTLPSPFQVSSCRPRVSAY